MNLTPLEQLTYEAFAPLAKAKFHVWLEDGNFVELELSEVTVPRRARMGGAAPAEYECFTLIFWGPADRVLPQRIHAFETPALGRFELFIVPVGRTDRGVEYEATFNRRVQA